MDQIRETFVINYRGCKVTICQFGSNAPRFVVDFSDGNFRGCDRMTEVDELIDMLESYYSRHSIKNTQRGAK